MSNSSSLKKIAKKFAAAVFVIVFLFIAYRMGQWLIPFGVALALAYALHAPTKTLSSKLNVSSTFSAGILVLSLVSILVFFAIFMIPLLKNAVILLIGKMPKLIKHAPVFLNEVLKNIFQALGLERTFNFENELEKYISTVASDIPIYLLNFLNRGMTLIYLIMFAFMTPILTFYLLKDWEKIEEYGKILLKKIYSSKASNIFSVINSKLAAYIKGQLIICVILSILYSIGIYFIGTKEFVVCGIFSGFLSFAPFFGPFLGLLTTLTMSIDDFSYGYQYALLCCLYVVIPFLDSNFATPRLIGKKTGIHPFWILFSICATTSILGTAGIFISVPTAVILSAVCKEIARKIY